MAGGCSCYTRPPMDILFVASELAPLVKVGGLADVVAALSKALRLLGHRVTIAMPRFAAFDAAGVMVARRLTPIELPRAPGERVQVTLFDGRLGSGSSSCSSTSPALRSARASTATRRGITPTTRGASGSFRAGCPEVMRQRQIAGSPFDVVHAHDWAAAAVPYLMKNAGGLPLSTKSVLTIHNLAHQGRLSERFAALPRARRRPLPDGSARVLRRGDFLKGGHPRGRRPHDGVEHVRPRDPDARARRAARGVLRTREASLSGIVNGIDYAVWNPMTDPALIARYDAEDTGNKGRCKSALLQELGLEVQPDRPLIVSVGRVVTQKGSDLLAAALPKILKNDVAVAIAGAGDPALMSKLRAAVAKTPERAAYVGFAPEPLVHRMLAGADLVVVPSRFEPCGLVQLYAQRYGAAPIACRTGGLIDTIVDLDAELETGTGFCSTSPRRPRSSGAFSGRSRR
jgi:starch synthase